MNMELVIRYLGFGKQCSGCGRVRETTGYEIRQGEDRLQQFLVCDACQDKGYVVKFQARHKPTTTKKERQKRLRISRKLEKGIAKDIDGQTTPGSGNRDVKCDVRRIDEWRIEHKYTDNIRGYNLLIDALNIVIHHANLAGEWPALVINFRRLQRKFAVIPYEVFLAIVEKLREQTVDHK